MFADAVEQASGFTFPYVALRRRADGSVFTLVASFILVNAEGWVLTSAHVIEELLAAQCSIEANDPPGDDASGPVSSRITHREEIWAVGQDAQPRLAGGRVNPVADLAIGRLEPFDPAWMVAQPLFRDTGDEPVRPGESVCRLGYPFHTVGASWDEESSRFVVANEAFPVPRFAMDGVVARFNRHMRPEGSALFIEVSTPGLRGQSGGPVLDRRGRVLGVQSQTAHLDLGFDARYVGTDGLTVSERQFLNVGMASHVDEVRALLDSEGVAYRV